MFRNRKGYFSLNIQAVCGPDLKFYDVVSRWPGSTHDSRIFENSMINLRLEQGEINGHLLGDAGYALKQYLLTPYPDPRTVAQKRYNKRHSQSRMFIEKAFGCLKRRFPLLKHGVRLRKPEDNCILILSAFVLHNMCIEFKQRNEPDFSEREDEDEADLPDPSQTAATQGGLEKRDSIASSFL